MATPFVSTEDGGVPTSFFGMDEEDGGCTIMTTAGTSGSNNIDGIEDAGGGMVRFISFS